MPRTEKKFGQANQVSGHGSTEVVASSANRKNILLNITARADSRIGVATFNGATAVDGGATYSALGSAAAPVSSDQTSLQVRAFALNSSGTKVFAITNGNTQSVFDITYTSTGASYVRSSHSTSTAMDQLTPQAVDYGSNQYNDSDMFKNGAVWISSSHILVYTPEVTSATSTEVRLAHLEVASASINVLNTYYLPADDASSTLQFYRGVYALQDGFGYALHGASQASVTNGEIACGMRVFSSATQSGRVWWDLNGTAGRTAGLAQNFFSISDYNPTYSVWAFSSTKDAASPWLGVTATGGAGSLATNLPSMPASAAPAGFRIVANNGTNGSDRKFLDGTISYPSAPTGITVPNEANTNPSVAALKFSPNGEHLLVVYSNNQWAVYSRQENGSWTFTSQVTVPEQSAGVPWNASGPDSYKWSADGKIIFAVTNGQGTSQTVYAVNAPYSSSTLFDVVGATTFTNTYTTSPGFPVMTGSGGSVVHAGSSSAITSTTISHASGVGLIALGSVISGSRPLLLVATTEDGDLQTGLSDSIWTISPSYNVSVGDNDVAPGYVNTAIADLEISGGSTLQVSGIVLENGESLRVGVADNNAIDVVAYGVEIS
jgi:hypothetical protein